MFELDRPSAYLQRKSRSSYDEGWIDGRDVGLTDGVRFGVEAYAARLEQLGLEVPSELTKRATQDALVRVEDLETL